MHCTSCGAALTAASKFCTSCGTPAVEAPPAPAPAPDPAPAPYSPAPPLVAPPSAALPPQAAPGIRPTPGFAPEASGKQLLPPVMGGFTPIGPPQENPVGAFFSALFDFSFERHATPRIVKTLFILAIVGGGLWALLTFVSMASLGGATAVVGLLIAPFFFLLFVAYTRILLELVLSVSRMEQHTRTLAEQARRDEAGTSEPR